MELKLEVNPAELDILKLAERAVLTGPGVSVLLTPPVSGTYWSMRVLVQEKPEQAVVCFPKFFTVGIGFQHEDDDWNTNLPYLCDAEEIYEHIKANSRSADRGTCIKAIRLLKEAITKSRPQDDAELQERFRRRHEQEANK